MPFKSAKQRKYLYAQKPDVAEKLAKHQDQKANTRLSVMTQQSQALRKGS